MNYAILLFTTYCLIITGFLFFTEGQILFSIFKKIYGLRNFFFFQKVLRLAFFFLFFVMCKMFVNNKIIQIIYAPLIAFGTRALILPENFGSNFIILFWVFLFSLLISFFMSFLIKNSSLNVWFNEFLFPTTKQIFFEEVIFLWCGNFDKITIDMLVGSLIVFSATLFQIYYSTRFLG